MNQRRRNQATTVLLGFAVGAIAGLAQRLAPDRAPQRPAGAGEGGPAAEDRAPADTFAASDPARHPGDAQESRRNDQDHHDDPQVVDELGRDELEDRQRLGALRTGGRVHEEGEEGGQGEREHGAQGRPQVHEAGEPGRVVAGDRVAAGGRHELARVGLRRAAVRALAAVVAAPELLAGEERVLHPDLGVPDHPARERRVVLRERADRGAVAAAEAGAHVRRAVPLQLGVEADVGQGGHARSSAWYRKYPSLGRSLDLAQPAVAAHAHHPEDDLVGGAADGLGDLGHGARSFLQCLEDPAVHDHLLADHLADLATRGAHATETSTGLMPCSRLSIWARTWASV